MAITAGQGGRYTGTGRRAEQAAHRLLLEQGYKPVARNVRGRLGEIDVVAKAGDTLVFVEVKSRSAAAGTGIGTGAGALAAAGEAISPHKQRRLRRLAAWYLAKQGWHPETSCRFDAVLVAMAADGEPSRVTLTRNAF